DFVVTHGVVLVDIGLAAGSAPRPPGWARWGKVPSVEPEEAGNYRRNGLLEAMHLPRARISSRRGSATAALRHVGVGGEALAAAALGIGVGVAEQELFAQALFDQVDLGAVDLRQAQH